MLLLDSTSLVKTLDNINESFLNGVSITPEIGLEASRWIASRQGEKGSYRGMFAPTQLDFKLGIHVFTGETLTSASARHIMGEEAARAVWFLGVGDPAVRAAYNQAIAWMGPAAASFQEGTFCCGRCTLAFWRHYWVGDFPDQEELLVKGLQVMHKHRQGDGKWRRFPFFYAVYTLMGIDLEAARAELAYARPVMERYVRRTPRGSFSHRRKMIMLKTIESL